MRRSEAVVIGKHSGYLEVQFSANDTVRTFALTAHPHHLIMSVQAEALHLSLQQLKELLEKYSPMMSESTEKAVDRAIKYGAVFAEVVCPILHGTSNKLTPDS